MARIADYENGMVADVGRSHLKALYTRAGRRSLRSSRDCRWGSCLPFGDPIFRSAIMSERTHVGFNLGFSERSFSLSETRVHEQETRWERGVAIVCIYNSLREPFRGLNGN